MAGNERRSLFEMVLKASPHPGFVYTPKQGLSPLNSKMKPLHSKGEDRTILDMCEISLGHAHPSVFPIFLQDTPYFLVILPMLGAQKEETAHSERLGFILENKRQLSFKGPLLKEEAWHEINNPLAIISLTLQKAFKKVILDQKDIDELLKRLDENFSRIDSYIVSQIQGV